MQLPSLPSAVSSAACGVSPIPYSKAPVKPYPSSTYSLHGDFQRDAQGLALKLLKAAGRRQALQNHRMVGVGRALCGSSSPTPLPKQGHPEQAAQDLVQDSRALARASVLPPDPRHSVGI